MLNFIHNLNGFVTGDDSKCRNRNRCNKILTREIIGIHMNIMILLLSLHYFQHVCHFLLRLIANAFLSDNISWFSLKKIKRGIDAAIIAMTS